MSVFRYDWSSWIPALCFFLHVIGICGGEAPPASGNPIVYSLYEEQPAGTLVADVRRDSNVTSQYSETDALQLRYSLRQASPAARLFALDDVSGVLRTAAVVDREQLVTSLLCPRTAACDLYLDVAFRPLLFFRIVKIRIRVLDINDNAPMFSEERLTVQVSEASPLGSLFLLPSAEDADSGPLGIQTYRLLGDHGQFELRVTDQADGSKDVRLRLVERLDRETTQRYVLKVEAADGGRPPRTGSLVLDVLVVDANDNSPRFDKPSYEVSVGEDTPPLTTILLVHASDLDEGLNAQVSYSLAAMSERAHGALVGVDPLTGAVFLRKQLDYEQVRTLQLVVIATDSGPGSQPVSVKVTITVLDINDNAPEISVNVLTGGGGAPGAGGVGGSGVGGEGLGGGAGTDSAQVRENAEPGTFVAHIAVRDRDDARYGDVDCGLDDVTMFRLEPLFLRREYKLTTRVTFDREAGDAYAVVVTCWDGGALPDEQQVSSRRIEVQISDENDNSPLLPQARLEAQLSEGNAPGALILSVNASDRDEGRNRALLYRLRPLGEEEGEQGGDQGTGQGGGMGGNMGGGDAAVSIDPITGQVRANVRFDFERRQRYEFLLTVSDHGDPPRSATATLALSIRDVNDELPQFEKPSYTFVVRENVPIGTLVGELFATDADASPEFSYVTYGVKDAEGMFDVDPASGRVSTASRLDRERLACHVFGAIAFNDVAGSRQHQKNPEASYTRVNVTVYVDDENDNRPVFLFPSPTNHVVQLRGRHAVLTAGSIVARLQASDPDAGRNAEISYELSGGNAEQLFVVDPLTGVISAAVDQDAPPSGQDRIHRLVVLARDEGTPPRASFGDLLIVANNSVEPLVAAAALGGVVEGGGVGLIAGVVVGAVMVLVVVAVTAVLWRRRCKRRREERERREDLSKNGLSCRSCSQQLNMLSSRDRADSRGLVPPLPPLDLGSTRSLSSYDRGSTSGCRCGGLETPAKEVSPLSGRMREGGDGGDEEDDEDSIVDLFPLHFPPPPLRSSAYSRASADSEGSDAERYTTSLFRPSSTDPGADRQPPGGTGGRPPSVHAAARRARMRHHPCCQHHPRRRGAGGAGAGGAGGLQDPATGSGLLRSGSNANGKIPVQVTHFCINDDTESACSCSDSGQGPSEAEEGGTRGRSSRNNRLAI